MDDMQPEDGIHLRVRCVCQCSTAEGVRYRMRPKKRAQRISNGQVHGVVSRNACGSSVAAEKKMISARPTRFWKGTKPTPLPNDETRLSIESSLLSPIMK